MLDPHWFLVPRPRPGAGLRLFCFPHAGGGAAAYRAWPDLVGADIEVAAIRLPGRESRFAEPCFRTMADAVEALCDALEPGLDLPFAFFGHSLGALLAHATARALGVAGRPVHLFAAASGAPGHGSREPLHTLPADALVERLRAYGGLPDQVLHQDALISLLLPTIRADLELGYAYRPTPGLLTCPVTALGGVDDRTVEPSGLGAWRDVTEGLFRMHLLPGGHFFVSDQAERTAAEVVAALGARGASPNTNSLPARASTRSTEGIVRDVRCV
jgi:surfactin synthase thioesterase subunit